MGSQDEQRKSQFKPMLGMPGKRDARRAEPDAPANDIPSSAAGGKGGQFRRLPSLGKRRDNAASAEDAAAASASGSQSGWDDRFAARHAPERSSDTPPRNRAQRDDYDASAGRSMPRGDRSYADDFGASEYADERDRGSSRGGRDAYDESYAAPPRNRRAARDAAWAARAREMHTDEEAAWDDASAALPASRRDPWRRDWVQWTSTDLPVDDIMSYGADDFRRSRSAWGGEPAPYTMASVALEVDLPAPNAATATAKPPAAFKQLLNWANHRFAASARPTKRAMRVLLASTLLGIVLLSGLGTALAAYVDYTTIKGLATDALNSLGHLGDDLGLGKHATKMTDDQRNAAARRDVTQALNDMQELHDRLAHPDIILSLASHIGKVQTLLQSGVALSNVGIDAMTMLETLVPTLVSLSKIISSSPIATSTSPQEQSGGLTASDPAQIVSNLESIRPTLMHMIGLLQATPPSTLVAALNAKQQAEIVPLLKDLPGLPNALTTFENVLKLPSIDKLLGIDSGIPGYNGPVGYLIMTLDNSEIRPVGGFQGQFAVVGVDHGKIGHITLQNVYTYLEPVFNVSNTSENYSVYDNLPLPFEQWFPAEFKDGSAQLGWEMRNSGLSPDFPQSARYALWYLHNENLCVAKNSVDQTNGNCNQCPLGIANDQLYTCYIGGDRTPIVNSKGTITGFNPQLPMVGVIMIQSSIISQLLQITGKVHLGCPYNLDVDAAHLQSDIHFYQETYEGRQDSMRHCPNQSTDTVKLFTGLLTQALQEKIKDLPKDKLLQFLGVILQDLQTKNIQMFFTDPARNGFGNDAHAFDNGYNPNTLYPELSDVEKFLQSFHDSSELYQGSTDDSLSLNRADIVGWKLEPFVKVNVVDHVTLAHDGSASHQFVTTYAINVPPIVVGPDSKTNSITQADIENAVFDKVYDAAFGQTYNEYWRVYMNPNAQNVQGNATAGFYPPGSTYEDVPNRAFAAGNYQYSWTYGQTPNQNTVTISWAQSGQNPATLSWVVPNIVKHNGQYVLHLEPQSGVDTTMQVTITLPNGTTCQSWNGPLTQSSIVTVNAAKGACHG